MALESKTFFSHNNIRFIESDTFEWGPEKLEILHLDHNYMEIIEQDLFSGNVSSLLELQILRFALLLIKKLTITHFSKITENPICPKCLLKTF